MEIPRQVTSLLAPLCCSFVVQASDHPNWYQVKKGSWSAPPAMVDDVKSRLEVHLSQQTTPEKTMPRPLSQYTVQYQGTYSAGARLIEISGLCETHGRSGKQLTSDWVRVLDGGSCYFNATYDPMQKKFLRFRFNGLA